MERDEVLPLNGPNQNLDDLANVQGFDSVGKRNELYCFKLTKNGIYMREPILLKENKNDVYNDYEIDIILKNNMVICKGDSNSVNRIINSGSMFGNFVSDNKKILRKINKNYYIGSEHHKISSDPNKISSDPNDLTILNFKTQFPEDLKLLTNPPKESEFIIEGVLLDSFDNKLELLKGLFIKVLEIPQYLPSAAALKEQNTNFQKIITKNEENFNIKLFPEELKIRNEYDINLNAIKINNKILLSGIKFRT